MTYSLKKMWSVMIVSLLTTTYVAQAEDCYSTVSECSPSGLGDFSVNVDTLIWEAVQDGLTYGAVTDSRETDLKNPKFKWNAGVRVGFGYKLPCQSWDLAFTWTHFNSNAKSNTVVNNPDEVFFPVWGGIPTGGLSGATVSNHWRLHFNTLDADVGHVFCVSECLTLRPHIGLRAAWIHQKNTVSSSGFISTIAMDSDVSMRSKYEGVGLRAGVDSEWCFCGNWGIYGSVDASILAGRSENHITDSSTIFGDIAEFSQTFSSRACRAATDLAIGLRWQDRLFCCNSALLTLQLGWEHHMFFNQNNFRHFVSLFNYGEGERGDLCLQGLVISAKIDF